MPGYTTSGLDRIEGKYDLNTRAVNLEFARITSACPIKTGLEWIYIQLKFNQRTCRHFFEQVHRITIDSFQQTALFLHQVFTSKIRPIGE